MRAFGLNSCGYWVEFKEIVSWEAILAFSGTILELFQYLEVPYIACQIQLAVLRADLL